MSDTSPTTPEESNHDHEAGSPIRDLASHLRLWPIAVIGLVLDLWTKHWAMHQLPPAGRTIIPNLMSFKRSLNTGALFGMGKGLTPIFIGASFLALAFVLYLFIQSTPKRRSLHFALGLILAGALGNLYDRAFMIADVITFEHKGEVFTHAVKILEAREDGSYRVGHWPDGEFWQVFPAQFNIEHHQQGVVRDFIYMEPRLPIGEDGISIWPWVFNLADAWLVFGVGLLMLNFWWDRQEERELQRELAGKSPPEGEPSPT